MNRIFAALAIALLLTSPAMATDQADVMATVNQFVNGFNKGDIKSALAACADQTSIIDEFAPYEWHGAGACGMWASAFEADTKQKGLTNGFVTLGKPRHVDVVGDRAYVVAPVTFAYKLKGKATKEAGSTITLAMQKGATGWRITGWAWSKH